MQRLAAALLTVMSSVVPATASTLEISQAWSPAGDRSTDLPIYMTITNSGEADDLLRFRCPSVAHFSEKRTTDYGEGAPSAREVKSIAITPSGSTELKPGGNHLVLLKIIEARNVGDTYTCEITFRVAGRQTIDVSVKEDDTGEAPTSH